MSDRADAIRQRQLTLRLRSEALRQRLGEQARVLRPPLAWVDRARAAWQWAHDNPQWPLAGAVVFVVLRPRRALGWGARLFWAWKAVRRVQDLLNQPTTRR